MTTMTIANIDPVAMMTMTIGNIEDATTMMTTMTMMISY
jgi:hypothetical protein